VFIEEAKALALDAYPHIRWDDFCWTATSFETKRAHDKRELNLYFTRNRANRNVPYEPFEQPFADFAKATVCLLTAERGIGHKYQKQCITAFRFLYEAMLGWSTVDPALLTRGHFQAAAIAAHNAYSHRAAYTIGALLEQISQLVDEHEIARLRIVFVNPIGHPPHADGLDEESQAKGMLKLPSKIALENLALASNAPLDDGERILLRVIDLLVVGGFRIGEALTLPVNCWVEEVAHYENGRPRIDPVTGKYVRRYGLRYWPEKGGQPVVKWLADCSAPLADRAVKDLMRLCEPARRAAAVLERDPDRVPLPGDHKPGELLNRNQLIRALGLNAWGSVRSFISDLGVKSVDRERGKGRGRNKNLYRVDDIERALVNRRAALEVVRLPGRIKQMLSQSLCVMFHNQFHKSRATLSFLPELIGYKQISVALGNDSGATSIFSRRELTEPDGTHMRIKTHAFRHWLNTLAAKGGLSDLELALWMGRRDITQNEAYKHGTVAERVEWVRQALADGRLHGDIADIYKSINDPVERESFLEAFVSVAHFTPLGICLHDFTLEPCKYHLNCLKGCGEYLRTKGDKEEQRNIKALRVFTEGELEKAKSAMSDKEYGASNWVDHNKEILDGADRALAVDAEPGEAIVHVFPGGKVLGSPLT
jgi:hypothetical protein